MVKVGTAGEGLYDDEKEEAEERMLFAVSSIALGVTAAARHIMMEYGVYLA